MKYIKSFNEAKSSTPNVKKIQKFLNRFDITEYKINPDGTVDLGDDFDYELDEEYFSELKKLPIKFGHITGDFFIETGYELTTMEGFPRSCESFYFKSFSPKIKSLKGGPTHVSSHYSVSSYGAITSLEGGPGYVGGDFDLSENPVTSLKGSPNQIGGDFSGDGFRITSLKGCTQNIGGDLMLTQTLLTSLIGFPRTVTIVSISTQEAKLWDPTGIRDSECEMLYCEGEPLAELIDLFNPIRDWYRYESLNYDQSIPIFRNFKDSLDYNYLRQGTPRPQIDLFRLKEALEEFDIKHTKPFRLVNYDFINEKGEVVDFMGGKI